MNNSVRRGNNGAIVQRDRARVSTVRISECGASVCRESVCSRKKSGNSHAVGVEDVKALRENTVNATTFGFRRSNLRLKEGSGRCEFPNKINCNWIV